MTAIANATATLPSSNGISREQILRYPLFSNLFHQRESDASTTPSQKPSPRDWTIQGTSHLPVPVCSTVLDKIVIEVASPRPSRTAPTACPLSSSHPRLELPQFPPDFGLELTHSPARPHGTVGLETWSGLPLKASQHLRVIDLSSIGFLRVVTVDLRTIADSANPLPRSKTTTDLPSDWIIPPTHPL